MTINKRAGWWMRKLCEKVFAPTIFLHNHPNTWKEWFKQIFLNYYRNYYCRGAPLESRIKNLGARPWNGRPSWMNEAIKKLSWTDDKQKSRAAERHRGMCFICRRLRMRWPDAALGSSEAHICHRGSPLTLPSLTWDENGVVLSLSQHPDRVSDEVMVQHRLLPLRVAYELMTALVNYKPPGVKWSDLVFCSRRAPDLPGFGVDEVKKGSDRGENQLLAPAAQTRCWSVARQRNTSDCAVKKCTV